MTAAGNDGAAGWLGSHYWPLVAYLAVGPGIVGHTSFNLLLKYMHPLAIALPLALEPVGAFSVQRDAWSHNILPALVSVLHCRRSMLRVLMLSWLVAAGFCDV